MKKIFIIGSSLLALVSLKAQNIEVYKNGFAGLSPGWSSNYFAQNDVNGSQFFYQDWASGLVTNLQNQSFSTGYRFMFDKVGQSLYLKSTNADSNIVLLIDKTQIGSFTINTDKPHTFVPTKDYGLTNKKGFFEVLVKNDSSFTFLKLTTTKFVRADTHNMLKAINGDTKSSFVDDIVYYISYKKGALQKINLSEKNFKNALISKQAVVQNYISENSKKDKNEEFYIRLVEAGNK